MTSRNFRRVSLIALGVSAALAANTAWAQAANAAPQTSDDQAGEDMGVITVTGSRTITDTVRSPTPITSVTTEDLAMTTPSDTADALNKLPSIMGGRTPRTQGNGSTNNGGNTLSLRNFGASRTLVLMDGHRLTPSNQDGTVIIDQRNAQSHSFSVIGSVNVTDAPPVFEICNSPPCDSIIDRHNKRPIPSPSAFFEALKVSKHVAGFNFLALFNAVDLVHGCTAVGTDEFK